MTSPVKAALSAACITQVQVARKRLNMSDADYRAMLQRVAGVASSKELTQAAFSRVMDEFERLGFVSTARHEAELHQTRAAWTSSPAQRSKIIALWTAYKGQPDPDGLRRWLEHHHGISDVKFCSAEKARKVIGSLMGFKKKPQTP
jgi:hypothetical protein